MPIISLPQLFGLLSRDSRLMGVDLGSKTIGLAISDVRRTIATPFQTLTRGKFTKDATAMLDLMRQQQVEGLVFGLPVEMDGKEGARCQSTRSFIRNMAPLWDGPVVLWDERLSTAAVTRTLLEADTSRAKRALAVDKMAAAYILQGALDALGLQQQFPS